MRVFLLSDLHINPNNDENDVLWVKHFCNFMNSKCCSDNLIFVLGDIVDKGSVASFDAADRIFSYIESQLSSVHYQIAFLPGNHDYCDKNLNAFMQFCKRHQTFSTGIFDFSQGCAWRDILRKVE
jgi:UDP-2,3-diacylglucosamine pyrophosphatase LpxH